MSQIPDLNKAVQVYFAEKSQQRKNTVAKSIYASELGHPCERYLVYRQTRASRRQTSASLLMLFDLGEEHEDRAIRILRAAVKQNPDFQDCSIVMDQTPLPENEYGIHGRLDCALAFPNPDPTGPRQKRVPIEIKGLNESVYASANTVQEMINSKYIFMRKYPAQLTLYIHFLGDRDRGLFALVNKGNGEFKFIEVVYDASYCNDLLAKAKRVKAAVYAYKNAGGPVSGIQTEAQKSCFPERIFWTPSVCGRCPYLSDCMPDMAAVEGVSNLMADTELDEVVAEYLRLEPAGKKYNRLGNKIKDHVKAYCADAGLNEGDEKLLALPTFNILAKMQSRTIYDVPNEVKLEYKTTSCSPRIVEIERLGE